MSGAEAWAGLLASSLPWMGGTVGAFLLAQEINRRCGGHPLIQPLTQPVALAVALLIALLVVTGVPVQTYTEGTAPLRFLLGPATVALAVPMYEQRHLIARTWLPIGVSLLAGCVTAVVSVVGLAWATGLSETMMLSLTPKSATMPIAMEVSAKTGGLPTLTMVFVMATGLAGTALAGPLRRLVPGDDGRGMGFTLGLAAHGIGIGRAFQISPVAGVFAGLAMALNGIATAVLTPLILTLLRG